MIERAVILGLITAIVALTIWGARWWSRRSVNRLRTQPAHRLWSALGESPDGRPSLIVFSTPRCIACRTAQNPAVQAVEARFGPALRVLQVDLARQPAVAHAFGVLTAPSTAVLTRDGRLGSFNHGFAPADELAAQLSPLVASPALPR